MSLPVPDAAILLATYNGESFLPGQLESLAAQRGDFRWRLYWRDDGSTDGTRAALLAFQSQGRDVREVTQDPGRLGAARSFRSLLASASTADIYAFCDQDDVWLPDKVRRSLEALADVPAHLPAIYCSRQHLVDAELRPVGLSQLPRRPLRFENALVQNVATGCTLALNDAARRLVLAAPTAPSSTLHDWWCYILVTGAGGRVIFDPEPTVLYRQHGGNLVGAQKSFMLRAGNAIARGPAQFMEAFKANLEVLSLAEALLHLTCQARVKQIRTALELSPPQRMAALARVGLYRQTVTEDALLKLWFLLGPSTLGKAAALSR
jgi:glycosyltransferase involved in cell wall biosynthesis